MVQINNSISNVQVITIFNILRSLGLNTSHRGTKFINKSVQIVINSNSDVIVFENIYSQVAIVYGDISPKQVKNDINYALNSRNIKKTSENFERIFGFEYSISYFTNKKIIEEIARVVEYN